MKRYEYKTHEVEPKGWGFFGNRKVEGFEDILNKHGQDGWRYVDSFTAPGVYGEVSKIKLVFEREIKG